MWFLRKPDPSEPSLTPDEALDYFIFLFLVYVLWQFLFPWYPFVPGR